MNLFTFLPGDDIVIDSFSFNVRDDKMEMRYDGHVVRHGEKGWSAHGFSAHRNWEHEKGDTFPSMEGIYKAVMDDRSFYPEKFSDSTIKSQRLVIIFEDEPGKIVRMICVCVER